ncbi:MAG: PQQ-binding-like beta-propeller repeat protein [Synergistaceae bacterium]|nr:PQQ-binding-like beta-propeller repeat protein [Synergistaceae bacterium]
MKRKVFISVLFVFAMALSASAFSGHEKWEFKPDTGVTTGITVTGNTVLFGTETGKLYALNKNTGRQIWSYKVENTVYGKPSVSGSHVFFAEGDGEIVCLNISDGSHVWTNGGTVGTNAERQAVNDGLSDGAVAGGGLIYVSKFDRKVHAFNENDGRTVWTYTTGDQGVREAPAYANGLLFVGEYDGIFSILDAKTGKRLNGGGAGGAINTPIVSDGKVYFSSWDGSLNSVQIEGVIPQWATRTKDTITTQPAVGAGKVIVGTGRGNIVAFNEKDGRILWSFNTGAGNVRATPVIADGVVIAGSESGNVFVLDITTGKKVGTIAQGRGIFGDPEYSDGVLYLGSGAVFAYE